MTLACDLNYNEKAETVAYAGGSCDLKSISMVVLYMVL